MNLISVLVFLTVCFLLYTDASDIRTLLIRGPNPSFSDHVVQLSEPFNLTIDNFSEVSGCTYDEYINSDSSYLNFFNTGAFTIIFPEAMAEMSTVWQCKVADMNKTYYNYTFAVRVKGSKHVNVKLGGIDEIFLNTDLSVPEYDGIAEHAFEEGDLIDFSCGNPYNSGYIRMRYYDINGTMMTDSEDVANNYHLILRMLVKDSTVNGSFVDCTYIFVTSKTLQEFTYRTKFTVTTTNEISSNDFIVTVNDKELTALPRKAHGRDRYIYFYSDGEPYKLTCTKKNQLLNGDIQGKIRNMYSNNVVTKEIENTSIVYSTLIETENLDGMIFQCYSKTERPETSVDIMFSKEYNHDPIILGLQASNIIYQYNRSNEWVTHYRYTINQVLNLTCITEINRRPQWKYKVVSNNITSTIHVNEKYKTNFINFIFNMNVESNESIVCESTKPDSATKRMIIVLLKGDDGDSHQSNIVHKVILIVAVVVLIAATGFCAFHCLKSKGKKITEEQGVNIKLNYVE